MTPFTHRRAVADYAARIVERIAPPHLRQRAFLVATLAIEEGRDAEKAVREMKA